MKTYMAMRGDRQTMQLNDPQIKANGEVWYLGKPIIDGESPAFRAAPDAIKAAVKASRWAEVPADAIAHIGRNPSGLEIISEEEEYARRPKSLQAQIDRQAISDLYRKATRLANSGDEDNVAGPMRIRGKADALLAEWRAKYPAEAAQERKANLLSKANDLRSKASGALTYDADGSLSSEDQQARHDEFIHKAEAIEAEAATL